jgi:hypothetical protein
VQLTARVDPDRGTSRERRGVERAAADQDPARPPVGGEGIAVDPGGRRLLRGVLLDLGQALLADDCAVREHRPQRVEAAGPRRRHHVVDDRTARGELDEPLVGHARHQRLRRHSLAEPARHGGARRSGAGEQDQSGDDGAAHAIDPAPRVAEASDG